MTVADQLKAEQGLGDTLRDYAGQWVAIHDYEVVASAESLDELLDQIEGESEDTTVLQVTEDENVTCFF
jgi:Family of unknown function (DUF5678)